MPKLTLKSERQIQTRILSFLQTELGLNDYNPGSVLDVFTQAFAQQGFSIYYQIGLLSRLNQIDALTGDEVDLKAFEYGLSRILAKKTTGLIDILREDTFEKVATTFYAGSPAAIAGNTTIDVNDASNVLISTSGTLILGRGTNNEEEVTYSVGPSDLTNFWRFTLDAPLVNSHAIEESVILKQGSDETIVAGTTIIVPATGTSIELQFTTNNDAVLLAGEERIANVGVTAVALGTDSNIPIRAISGTSAFNDPPFTGARAENLAKFTTGKNRETDDQLKDRIKEAIPALSKGIKQAIRNAIVGLVDPITAKRIVSASVVLPVGDAGPVKIYIDDGIGFEPSFLSLGFETVKASATGGEERLQIDQFPIAKAHVENILEELYDMSSGALTLEFEVGSNSETITFNPSDFSFSEVATAEEVVEAINNKAVLIEARTSQAGKKIVVTSKIDVNESIQITGGTSNSILGFPTDRKYTLNLYIDDLRKSKDGETAVLDSGNTAPYNLLAVGAYPHELNVVVDGKTANPQVATIDSSDVVDTSAVTVNEIIAVLNRDLAGITASSSFSGTKVRLVSNTELSSNSKINVTGGSANDAGDGLNFSTVEKVGSDNDYIFNRELGIIELTTPLTINQNVTLGSRFTRGKLRAGLSENYTPSNGETLVIEVDGGSGQTITFDTSFAAGKSAALTADFINATLNGATAVVRTVGGINFLEIRTNTYETSGSIEITSASTANASFAFTLDTAKSSIDANKAFAVSTNSEPYDFAEADSLVVVVNNDIINNTFNILLNYGGTVTSGTSTTIFADLDLSNVFEVADELVDYYVGFTSGDNTTSETITTVADQTANIFRYTFSAPPTNYADFAIGDYVKITDLDDSGNNGYFLLVAKGASTFDVLNPDGVNASSQTGIGVVSQRRQVTAYNQTTGEITVGAVFRATPSIGDPMIIVPSTIKNLVEYIENIKITSFTQKGLVEGVDDFSNLQLSSILDGSDGYIQVTGGKANNKLGFATSLVRGLQAYNYWTGLVDLAHRVVYGDDTDLVSYPGTGAAGITFQILAPTNIELSVELDVTLAEGVSIASLENEIKSRVSGYINGLKVGEDVVVEKIRSSVIAITGVTDVSLISPTVNVVAAENELIRIKDPNILVG